MGYPFVKAYLENAYFNLYAAVGSLNRIELKTSKVSGIDALDAY